jgi:hypothetical protein
MRARLLLVLPLAVMATACSGVTSRPVSMNEYYNDETAGGLTSKVGGDEGLTASLFKRETNSDQSGVGLGVNAYLWRGALDTLSFMPLASADPFGGVIITDYYQPPSSPDERFKATAYILGRQLRADGVRVTVFRQVMRDGHWSDASVSTSTNSELENKVLARARELRSASASN